MKGIVFTEFIEMVETKFSPELADDLLDSCDLPSGGAYTSVGTYDHTEMATLITALSERIELPVSQCIHTFGVYLFERFNALYPTFFDGHTCALDFLAGIEDVIHVEVKKLYPDAQLPRFDIERPHTNTLIMTYRSERHLGDLAHGLIEQCIRHFDQSIELQREDLDDPERPVRFTLVLK